MRALGKTRDIEGLLDEVQNETEDLGKQKEECGEAELRKMAQDCIGQHLRDIYQETVQDLGKSLQDHQDQLYQDIEGSMSSSRSGEESGENQ